MESDHVKRLTLCCNVDLQVAQTVGITRPHCRFLGHNGQIRLQNILWHLTHRCHKRDFLFRLTKDKRRWLFEAEDGKFGSQDRDG